MRQARAARNVDMFMRVSVALTSKAFVKGVMGNPGITAEKLKQFTLLTRRLFYHYEDSFYQHMEGSLNDSAFDGYKRGVKAALSGLGICVRWRQNGFAFGRDFQDFMNGLMAETARAEPADALTQWHDAIAGEANYPFPAPRGHYVLDQTLHFLHHLPDPWRCLRRICD